MSETALEGQMLPGTRRLHPDGRTGAILQLSIISITSYSDLGLQKTSSLDVLLDITNYNINHKITEVIIGSHEN